MTTCWIALDPTTAAGGTIEYVRGSHKMAVSPPIKQFHARRIIAKEMRDAAARWLGGARLVPVEVPPAAALP